MRELVEQAIKLAPGATPESISCILHPGSRGPSGFVSIFLYDGTEPLMILKISRGDDSRIRREGQALDSLARILEGSDLVETVDSSLGMKQIAGKLVLVKRISPGETAVKRLRRGPRREAPQLLEACLDWLLRFLEETTPYRIHSKAKKEVAAGRLLNGDDSPEWYNTFVDSESQFLAPSHGDLVLGNILMEGGRVKCVFDFENFTMEGFPIAEVLGLIVSFGTNLYGASEGMIEECFQPNGRFASVISAQVSRTCNALGWSLEEFVTLMPLYSARALQLSADWGMDSELEFHTALEAVLVDRDRMLHLLSN